MEYQMKKMMKRWLVLLLALFLSVSVFTLSVRADDEEVQMTEAISEVNPLYEGVITEEELPEPDLSETPQQLNAESDSFNSVESAATFLRKGMVERQSSIVFRLELAASSREDGLSKINQALRPIFETAIEHTGNPKEGDYIRWQYQRWQVPSTSVYFTGSSSYAVLTYNMQYYTSASQEATMDTEVKKLLDQLDVYSLPAYMKIESVYQYLCDNVVYDYTNLNNDSYKLKYTAYAALINKTSVCQGYSVLFYRLMLELGVDARLVAGDAGSNRERHSWNIVKIGNYYYNVDATWDAGESRQNYRYFLRNLAFFNTEHFRDDEYNTAVFHSQYPMSPSDYVPATSVSIQETARVKQGENIRLSASVLPTNATHRDVIWLSFDEDIAIVDQNGVVTGISEGVTRIAAIPSQQWYSYRDCVVTVEKNSSGKIVIAALYFLEDPVNLVVGEAKPMPLIVLPGNAEESSISYTISDSSVVSIDSQGNFVGLKEGRATVTVTSPNGLHSASCTVVVSKSLSQTGNVKRLSGKLRYDTSLVIADEMKRVMGISKFNAVVLATGENFADALGGGYLAVRKNAPIILTKPSQAAKVNDYIKNNLAAGGTVYVLGGTGAVPDSCLTGLEGYNIRRLSGKSRYDTNLAILQEAGVNGEDLLICSGENYADALAASASGRPLLLVNNKKGVLNDAQKNFLNSHKNSLFYIIGGNGAVSSQLENQISSYRKPSRIQGSGRYETSVEIAKIFFASPSNAAIAYSHDFPDGLCAGPLAYKINAPILLTKPGKEAAAQGFLSSRGIISGYVIGGAAKIPDSTAKYIFNVSTIK